MVIESDNEKRFSDDESDVSYNKLYNVFEILYDEYKKLGSKYSLLKKNHACLLVKKNTVEKKACIIIEDYDKMNKLEEENKALKENVDRLKITLAKFTQGSKNLKTILAS
jgi:hypothetical protein